MPSLSDPLPTWRRALVGALLPLCLLAQSVWVPMHLALCEHLQEHANGGHGAIAIAPDHDASEHLHEHPGEDEDAGPHAPHPADDHDDQASELAVVPKAGHVALALVPLERTRVVDLFPSHPAAAPAAEGPRAPPPPGSVAPRAPPQSI